MRIITSLPSYAALDRTERLSAYLVEDVAATVSLEPVDDPLCDLRTIPGNDVLAYASSLPNASLRRAAAERLISVGRMLANNGYVLELLEAFRPYEKQKKEFDNISALLAKEYPELSKKALWRKITEFIADPDLCPPHLTGGAVDVRLLRAVGNTVDMGAEINALSPVAALMSSDISPEARQARDALIDAFLTHEFAPMPTEWWHFSFGDRYWGAFYDRPAIYDTIRP